MPKRKESKMKKYLTYAIAAFFATTVVAIASPETDMVQSKEKAAWQAFKDKKADDFKNLVDKDFRGVYAEGISSLQKELDDMKKWDMKSFSISDLSAFSDEPDVVVTTYIVKIEGTYDGKDASGTYNAGSVWKKEKDAWLAIFHTNSKQATAAK
jgi:ketosteroid isomerase-like protein